MSRVVLPGNARRCDLCREVASALIAEIELARLRGQRDRGAYY